MMTAQCDGWTFGMDILGLEDFLAVFVCSLLVFCTWQLITSQLTICFIGTLIYFLDKL